MVIAALLGALINLAIIRRFRNAPRLILTVATIGLAQILYGLALLIPIWIGGLSAGRFATPFDVRSSPSSPMVFDGNYVLVLIVAPLVMLAFGRVPAVHRLRRRHPRCRGERRPGESARHPRQAALDDRVGDRGLLSATAVILRIPLSASRPSQSVSGTGNALLLRTLAAAVLGRMENPRRTVVAAVGIGIFQEAASWQFSNTNVVDALLVVVILAGLFVQRDYFTRAAETGISTWRSIREVRPIPQELRSVPEVRYGLLGVRIAARSPSRSRSRSGPRPSQEQAAALVLIYSIVAVSLLVLTGWAGHISLGQFALVGFGGATTAVLYGRHGWDFLLAWPAGDVGGRPGRGRHRPPRAADHRACSWPSRRSRSR